MTTTVSARGNGLSSLNKSHLDHGTNDCENKSGMIILEGDTDIVDTNEENNLEANKKTDEMTAAAAPPSGGYLWRFSSGLVSTTTGAITGAVGLGVGSVKWVAGKSYDAGSGVINTTRAVVSKVPVPTLKAKSKKE